MFYPFLPGRVPWIGGGIIGNGSDIRNGFGLLLVPIGVAWLVYELQKQVKRKRNLPNKYRGYRFAITSVVAASIVVIAVTIDAFTKISISFEL